MAKLNVVIPSVDVKVDGVKYRKVEREAVAGDIVKLLEDSEDVTNGAFYNVDTDEDGDISFFDGADDDRYLMGWEHEVYEKVSEPSAPTKYREVKRKANVGERIKIVAAGYAGTPTTYKNGESFTVTTLKGDDGVRINRKWRDGSDIDAWVDESEYVVLEPITQSSAPTQPERLEVGEFAKVIDAEGAGNAIVGDIGVVTNTDWGGRGNITDIETFGGRRYGMFNDRFIRATEAEVAAAKKSAERTKAIGEFAEGGYAVMVNATIGNTFGFKRGDYVIVRIKPDYGPSALIVETKRGNVGYCNADALRKITKEEYEAATKPKPVYTPVKVGDKIRITRNQCNWAVGTIAEVTEIKTPANHESGTVRAKAGGSVYVADRFCFDILSAEEAKWNAIGRKVGEYKAGDVVEATRTLENKERVYAKFLYGPDSAGRYAVETADGSFRAVLAETTVLIAPVESLFNATTEGGDPK